MRVIKEGRTPTKEIEKTYKQCGCVFAYERGDVQSETQYNETSYWVECPTCHAALDVKRFPNY